MNKALFLDRDGTINLDYGYVYKIEDFVFIDGVFEFCKLAKDKGYKIIVITNQSGIERGYYDEAAFHKITKYMKEEFLKRDIEITDVFFCSSLSGEDRKPNAGMFLKAKAKYDIDMKASVSVGDKQRDIEAALAAGVIKNYLFENNYKELEKVL